MKRFERIVIFWGICDLAFFAIYTISSLVNGNVPFYSNLIEAKSSLKYAFADSWAFIVITILSSALYISIPISGILLILKKRIGILLAYVQTPFRIAMVAPSLYFFLWFLSRFVETPLIIGAPIAISAEIIKVYTLIKWQKVTQKLGNHASPGISQGLGAGLVDGNGAKLTI